jgi:hypothetical protein
MKRVPSCRHKRRGVIGAPGLLGDESGNERELANTELSIQPSASQERVNLQYTRGHFRKL